MPKEEDLFNLIKAREFLELSANERKTLFFSLAEFDGVGTVKLKDIALFRNINGVTKPLGEMVAYRDNTPLWLSDYILCKEDNDADLSDYLISQEDEFASIIQEHINDIETSFSELYSTYKEEWTGQFTRQLIDYYDIDDNLLTIIEDSDRQTKNYFLNSIKKLELHSTSTYKKNSYEYRVLQLALSTYDDPSVFSSKIYFDEKCIKDFSVSDEVVCDFDQNGKNKKVKMSLAKLLPQYQNQSDVIEKIKALFESKKDLEKLFIATPKSIYDVHKELNQFLGIPESYFSEWTVIGGNPQQFLFATYYRRHIKHWNNLYVPKIDLGKETVSFVHELFDFLYNNNISIIESPFTYHLKESLTNKYFGSDYIYENEQLSPAIEKWADDDKKKKYLTDNGVRTSYCNGIQFRQLFLENKPIDFIEKLTDCELSSGIFFLTNIEWIDKPFKGGNQKAVLLQLKNKRCCNLSDKWNEKDIIEKSEEWNSKVYNKWINTHYPHIFIYPGFLPRQLSYKDIVLLNYDDPGSDYYYDTRTRQLYICNSRKIEDILFEVAKDRRSDLDFDDYKELCWGNDKVPVSKEDIEKKDKTIESLEESNRKKDEIIENLRAKLKAYEKDEDEDNKKSHFSPPSPKIEGEKTGGIGVEALTELERMPEEAKNKNHSRDDNDENDNDHGNASDRGNLDDRVELNQEARIAAKDYLDSLEDYDCTKWDPYIGNGLVKGIVKYKDKTITVVVTSSIGRKLYLHPRLFSELMIDSDNLLLNYGYDRRIHRINFDETFKDNKDVNLIFDKDIITSEEFAYLANRYKYSKKTCFVIENITYSISEQIRGFGLDEKMSDSDVYTNINTDELFDF